MALDITGKLIQLLPLQEGTSARGTWSKQEFILETQEQYPKKVCISVWGDKVNDLTSISIGEVITVGFNIESREFNGRWYTDVRAWRIQKSGSVSPEGINVPPPPAANDFAYGENSNDSAESVDDLPF